MSKKISFKEVASIILSVALCVGIYGFFAKSGSLTPPGTPASTMFSLSDIVGSGFASTTHSLVQIKAAVDAAGGVDEQIYSLTANDGMYNNKIPNMTPPLAYTEVCFKSGATSYDAHSVSESTAGGNCVPGDVGYIIEKSERTANYWELARQTCLQNNMRLPEPFEWKLACKNAATWSLLTMIDNWEWASNFSLPVYYGAYYGVGAAVFGNGGCNFASWSWVGYDTGLETSLVFRCVR